MKTQLYVQRTCGVSAASTESDFQPSDSVVHQICGLSDCRMFLSGSVADLNHCEHQRFHMLPPSVLDAQSEEEEEEEELV